jgi:hypothetical protein
MTPIKHYLLAEKLLERAGEPDLLDKQNLLMEALVHALLSNSSAGTIVRQSEHD